MPSTYSDLKIELMATGEENTTWGDITNLNLEALEEAISASADVTFASADVTLTLANTNASQTARSLRLRCTGVTGGTTRNLVVPTTKKPYIVRNDCADSILVKTASGTGITVPAGKSMWVFVDGTNVVDVETHLSGLTLSTALPVASGGTGATETAAARTNLGATTVGSNLFALTDPSAVTFLRLNADNTVSALDAADFRSAIGVGTGTGTVLSVDASGGATGLSFSGGPITSSGTLTLAGTLAVTSGGTGGTTASAARGNLGAAASGAIGSSGLSMSTARIIGRTTAGTGAPEEITIGAGLTLSGGSLSAVGGSGTVTSVTGTGTVNGLTLSGTVTTSGNLTLGGTLSGVSLTSAVTGTLPVANGGTGATTASAARAAIGAGTGTVTSVSGTGTVNGLTLSGSVTASGNLTLGGTLSGVDLASAVTGTLPVANGGTGVTTSTGTGSVVLSAGPTFSDSVGVAAGTRTDLSVRFATDTDTGFYLSSANVMEITAGGVLGMTIGAGATATATSTATTAFRAASGSVSVPGFGFTSDTDTGFFLKTTGSLAVATSGVERFSISGAGFVSTVVSRVAGGSNLTPGYSFTDNPDTGFYLASGPTRVVTSIGSTPIATASSTGLEITGQLQTDTLRIDQTASASTTARTHSVPVNINGTTYYLMLSDTP